MEKQDTKQSEALFVIWRLVFAALLIYGTVCRPSVAGIGAIRTAGLWMCGMLDLLLLAVWVTGRVDWIVGSTAAEKPNRRQASGTAGAAGRYRTSDTDAVSELRTKRRLALRCLVCFLAATAVYAWYCFWLAPRMMPGAIRDSLTAGGVICAAALTGGSFPVS